MVMILKLFISREAFIGEVVPDMHVVLFPEYFLFVECTPFICQVLFSSTRQKLLFVECFYFCRLFLIGHSVQRLFAECPTKSTWQNLHMANSRFRLLWLKLAPVGAPYGNEGREQWVMDREI